MDINTFISNTACKKHPLGGIKLVFLKNVSKLKKICIECEENDSNSPSKVAEENQIILKNKSYDLAICEILSQMTSVSSFSLDIKEINLHLESYATLSSKILKLKQLKTLNLDFQSTNLPTEATICLFIGIIRAKNLSSLSLNMSSSKREDRDITYLSEMIVHLKQCQTLQLNLSFNKITEKGIFIFMSACSELYQLTSLSLNLDFNQLNRVQDRLSCPFTNLNNLSYLKLNLQSMNLNPFWIKALFDSLDTFTQLQNVFIDLDFNRIEQTGINHLFKKLRKLSKLTSLSLSIQFNCVSLNGGSELLGLETLGKLSNLTLNVANNQILFEGISTFINSLAQCKSLTTLSLNCFNIQIQDKGAIILAETLQQLQLLTSLELDLGSWTITQIGVSALYERLAQIKQLSSLTLNLSIILKDTNAKTLFLIQGLEKLKELQKLKLSLRSNNIDCKSEKMTFPFAKFFKMKILSLNLNDNKFGDDGIIAILDELVHLKKLCSLSLILQNVGIVRKCATYFLQFLNKMSHLKSIKLDLSRNFIDKEDLYVIQKEIDAINNNNNNQRESYCI